MLKNKVLALVSVILFSSVGISGCGYTSSSLLPKGLDTIHVDNFANGIDTTREVSDRRMSYFYKPGIETEVTRAVIDGFIFDRHLSVQSGKEADLTLKGTLVDYKQYPLSYNRDDDIEEYRVEILVNIELVNNKTGEVMWTENNFMGQANFNVIGPNRITDPEAQSDAVKDLSARIVERVVEAW
jgi:hypothetical protein